MKTAKTNTVMKNKRIIFILLATVLILLIPLVAMQFTDEVNWDVEDFIVIGALLLGVGCVFEALARRMENRKQRFILGLVCVAGLGVVWVELAVGIFN